MVSLWVASYILAHGATTMTARDVQRGNRTMRNMTKDDVRDVMGRLEVAGWVEPSTALRADSMAWLVNPAVHERFAAYAERERQRREEAHQKLRTMRG